MLIERENYNNTEGLHFIEEVTIHYQTGTVYRLFFSDKPELSKQDQEKLDGIKRYAASFNDRELPCWV